ncbi:MAG: very short patch repair endonuclease [Propionibacteriaceae bacterium]
MTKPLPPGSTDERTSTRMSRQRTRDTEAELRIRGALHRRGWRFRVDAPLPGMPRRRADILFTRRRLAIFVDGCFWHSCPTHGTKPLTHAEWWRDKLAVNVARDRETDSHLESLGWSVVRVWECTPVEDAVAIVEAALDQR